MFRIFDEVQKDLTDLFTCNLPVEASRGSITDHLIPIRPHELSTGMIAVSFKRGESIRPRACYQQISDHPQTLHLIQKAVDDEDLIGFEIGYLNPDSEDLKIIWVFNDGMMNRIKCKPPSDEMVKAFVVEPSYRSKYYFKIGGKQCHITFS